jgi:tetratricopeptide (TPR) repeat protein
MSWAVLFSLFLLAGSAGPSAQAGAATDWKGEAQAAASRRDWDQAIADYEKELEQTPQDAKLRVEYAIVLKSAGRFAEAIGALRAALRINPRNERAELELGDAYRQIYNYDEARRIFETARREHPRSSAPLVSLGLLGIELQTYDAAIAHLQAALRLAPSDLTARDDLAAAYHAKGDQANALVQLNLIIAKDFGMHWRTICGVRYTQIVMRTERRCQIHSRFSRASRTTKKEGSCLERLNSD